MAKMLPMGKWIVGCMSERIPIFVHLAGEKRAYWFRRLPNPHRYSFIHILSSQKQCALGVSVASTFFPAWNRQYGDHQMVSATGLPNLRLGSSAIPMEEEYYTHNGTEASARATVERIVQELIAFALPFFEQYERKSAADPLLKAGLDWLRQREEPLPNPLFVEQEKVLLGRKTRVRVAQGTVLDELKLFLRQECTKIGASNWHRKQTAILGRNLLEYAEAGLLDKARCTEQG
jgi:hypothetical protein